ncbi:MAG TPA: glycoside hydrolase family 2 TIM barrel-domain containing protein [Nonomuraea sp.]|nr:glycoside hydrolase family 2 TIM barrel-domain containing protein [Nonomuraea sp.]
MPSAIPRPEHPRPSLMRTDWLNLNGGWQFEIDAGDSGLERGLLERELSGRITVPFAPETELSGVANVDFMEAVWYRRTVRVPGAWSGRTVLLHFGAVDHDATVWVNGREVVRHRGGFTPFTADVTGVAVPGEDAVIVVRARDSRHSPQARGKQSRQFANAGCLYTRTTGIWQTVWLEPVGSVHAREVRVVPQLASDSFDVTVLLPANRPGHRVRLRLTETYDHDTNRPAGALLAEAEVRADLDLSPRLTLRLPEGTARTWSPSDPHLYGLTVQILDADGAVVDEVRSYAGLRSVSIDGKRLLLNGRPVFQRLVLDQGYWPQSLMTAPSDRALAHDIELGLAAGFNGARLHQKVFEERYLYHADRLGYLVWGEFGDWGVDTFGPAGDNQQPTASMVTQWLEAVRRDLSHPSIVGWCPLNETSQILTDRITQLDDVTRAMWLATKLADPTRPVLDVSGYAHRVPETDVVDSHDYEQDPAIFAANHAGLASGRPFMNTSPDGGQPMSAAYRGQPYFVSEFGGIWWVPDTDDGGDALDRSWGYGDRPTGEEEFYARFGGLVAALLDNPDMFGYCYTQLTDVFQERNGIYAFDRSAKLDVARVRAIQLKPAAAERSG